MFFEELSKRGLEHLLIPKSFVIGKSKHTPRLIEWMNDILVNKKSVLIDQDGDWDGIQSANIIYRTFKKLGHENADILLLTEKKHTVTSTLIREAIRRKVDYVFLVDSSTNDIKTVQLLNSFNIKVIILDHHTMDIDLNSDMCISINSKAEGDVPRKYISAGYLCFEEMTNCLLAFKKDMDIESFILAYTTMISDTCNLSNDYGVMITNKVAQYKTVVPKCVSAFFNDYDSGINRNFISFSMINRINACIREGRFDLINKLVFTDKEPPIDEIERVYSESRELRKSLSELADVEEHEHFILADINRSVRLLNKLGDVNVPNYTGVVCTDLIKKYQKLCLGYINLDGSRCKGSVRDPYNRDVLYVFDKIMMANGHGSAFGVRFREHEIDTIRKDLIRISKRFTLKNEDAIILADSSESFKRLMQVSEYNEIAGFDAPYAYIKVKLNPEFTRISKRGNMYFVTYRGKMFKSFVKVKSNDTVLIRPTVTDRGYSLYVQNIISSNYI